VGGHDVTTDPWPFKRLIGYLPENAPAYPEMTVDEFLGFVAETRGFRDPVEKTCPPGDVVQLCHLEPVRRQSIETCLRATSSGSGFAQALLHDPPVLVLDEPTDGLDPNQKPEVREIIQTDGRGETVILSTHILEEVEAICTRIIIISAAGVVVDDTPAGLRARHGGARLDEIFTPSRKRTSRSRGKRQIGKSKTAAACSSSH